MPYEFNPLLPDGFQKKSAVTPADIARLDGEISDLQTTTTDLKQKKVTKFFSANDFLEDNEIAQYQGEDDAVNNLVNGFFYKKNPAFTLTANADSFSYIVGRKINWYLRNNTLKVTQYYLGSVQSEYNDFNFSYDSVRDVEVIFFADTYAKSPALKPAVRPNTLYYPFAIVSNQFDYNNPVEIINGDYYYKGAIINFTQSSGGVTAILCASIEAPYYRYLWLPVIMRGGTFWYAAFLYETNSNNEFVILGVDNNLSAFDICRDEYEYIVPAFTINAQGYVLTDNQRYSLCRQPPRYTPSSANVDYNDGSHYLQFHKNGLGLMVRGFPDKTKTLNISNVSTKYPGLIPIAEYYSNMTTAITYRYNSNTDTIIFSTNVDWPTVTTICVNDNILTEIDIEDITIL